MIDINQIQIGDWVRLKYTNEYRSVDEYVRINGILAKGCANQYGGDGTIWGEGHGNLGNGDILFPIPLTAEILEKNGFVYEHDYGSYYRSRWGDIPSGKYVTIGWNSKGEIYQYDVVTPLDAECGIRRRKKAAFGDTSLFVHELQNTLKTCGLNDLAENFQL